MRRFSIYTALFILLSAACTSAPKTSNVPTTTQQVEQAATVAATDMPAAAQTGAPAQVVTFDGLPLPADRGQYFSTSGACVICHLNSIDEAGNDVSTDALWRSTMLANAARDPYWQATVRSEVDYAPDLKETVEKKCSTCHMPMAEFTAAAENDQPLILDSGFLDQNHPLHSMAMDAVSCTLCHQIESGNFGQAESFSGGFQIDTSRPSGERVIYGIFDVAPGLATQMQAASGFAPQQSDHLAQAEMCSSCHDLITPYLDAQGQVAGEFPEQMIYSEWEHSSYPAEQTCQDCHMPPAQGSVSIATTGGPKRSPFRQHVFVGGNAFMLRLLQANAEAIQTTASTEHFQRTIQSTEDLIALQTAAVSLEDFHFTEATLQGEVLIQSRVGHKFPGGYPSRRAWLHIQVLDQEGKIIFESGAFQPDGSIIGNDNDEDPGRYEPHYASLSAADQVQIYESIMLDTDGKVTTNLLRGASYGKDNRLLPAGFDLQTADPSISVYGDAAQDSNFLAGGDRLTLVIDLDPASGPLTLRVELLYQSVGYRWAANILTQSSAEAQTFAQYYEKVSNLPLVVASAELQMQP